MAAQWTISDAWVFSPIEGTRQDKRCIDDG
jgi:hypothetical protein